jgi:formyltetrahydrofolate hydrolase
VKLKIDSNNLEVKYIIGNFRDLRDFPTKHDIAYILIQWMILNEKNPDDSFSDNIIIKQVGKSFDELKEAIDELIDDGVLEHVKDTNTKSIYKIIKNPFE